MTDTSATERGTGDAEIEAIRERLKFCSGPWYEKTDAIVSDNGLVCVMNTERFDYPEDQRLIAHAPNDIDTLLRRLDVAAQKEAALKAEIALHNRAVPPEERGKWQPLTEERAQQIEWHYGKLSDDKSHTICCLIDEWRKAMNGRDAAGGE